MRSQRLRSVRTAAVGAALLLGVPTARAALIPSFQATGNLELGIAAVGLFSGPTETGTLTLTGLSPGFAPQQAYLYAIDTNASGITGTFAGGNLSNPAVFTDTFNLIQVQTYRWDVTSQILPGLTQYAFALGDGATGNGIATVGLAVVASVGSGPLRTVTIIDGIQQVGEAGAETESVAFTGLPGGSTSLWVYTAYDDAGDSNDAVSYNGTTVASPIDQNLSVNASLFQISTTSLAGSNTLSVSTQTDHMALVLAATAVVVPEPGTLVLCAAGFVALAAAHRRRSA